MNPQDLEYWLICSKCSINIWSNDRLCNQKLGNSRKSTQAPFFFFFSFAIAAPVFWTLYLVYSTWHFSCPLQLPIISLSLFALRLQGIGKMFLIIKRETWEPRSRLFYLPWQIWQSVFIFKAFVCLESSHSEKAGFSVFQRELVVFFGFWFLSFGKIGACSSVALKAWNLSSLTVGR